MSKAAQRKKAALDAGLETAKSHPVLWSLAYETRIEPGPGPAGTAWAFVDGTGKIVVNPDQDGQPGEWAWVIAHLLLHLGLGHLDEQRLATPGVVLPDGTIDPVYAAACCVAVNRFADVVRVGNPIVWLPEMPGGDELELADQWRYTGVPPEYLTCGTGGTKPCLIPSVPPPRMKQTWGDLFARGLVNAASSAISRAAENSGQYARRTVRREWHRALDWFVSSYPLLGAVAAGLTLVDEPEIAAAWDITYAAVNAEYGEVYVNPNAALGPDEWRFVLAHEMLHAALGHAVRSGGRDPYLWNVACDYVINGWLVEMAVGTAPEGVLYDPELAGLSAESVYDTLVTDLRRSRKLATFGSRTAGDILGDWLSQPQAAERRGSRRGTPAPPVPYPWDRADRVRAVDLDEFYRRALATGLEYHHSSGRGLVPAGLEEAIRALDHPPLPWDAQLARWFDEHLRNPEPQRSYARASRRQSATPDIPRPGRLRPEELVGRPTFGVVLDTSGSMSTELLGKALGAIASYAAARDVPAARVVFCDAVAYDAGYLRVEDIAGRVTVRGRGGTILQPGVRLLENAADFPATGPILVITDAECDVVRIRREHAFLIPAGAALPFRPHGPTFRVR